MSENLKVGQLQPIYPAKEHEHMRALLDFAVEEYGDDTAFILKKKPASRKEQPTYKKVTYKELREDVRRLGTGLIAMGVRNARIAIIGENSYYWQLAYLTAMCGLGICVPLDKGLPYAELKTSILKSGSTVLIFDKKHAKLAEQLQKDAQGLKDELSARLESAQSESDRIVREALTRAENTERDIVAKARKEAASILDKAEEDARREKRQAMNDARDEVASLAVALAEQALEKQLDDEGRSRLMDDCIERLGKTDA